MCPRLHPRRGHVLSRRLLRAGQGSLPLLRARPLVLHEAREKSPHRLPRPAPHRLARARHRLLVPCCSPAVLRRLLPVLCRPPAALRRAVRTGIRRSSGTPRCRYSVMALAHRRLRTGLRSWAGQVRRPWHRPCISLPLAQGPARRLLVRGLVVRSSCQQRRLLPQMGRRPTGAYERPRHHLDRHRTIYSLRIAESTSGFAGNQPAAFTNQRIFNASDLPPMTHARALGAGVRLRGKAAKS
mmetsp:Transcript_73102/g.237765  ORF Transcript_73102/g.237765 Transcript_73102/m.237765 type:complete len:241 (+) Transcript_73102:495-1217(+)